MRISDWSSDVCSSDLAVVIRNERRTLHLAADPLALQRLTELAQIDVDQIGGPPVNRCLIAPLPLARASDFRFEIAGGKGRAIPDLNRFEITIKKCAGVPIAPACCCGASLLPIASPLQAAMVCSPNKDRKSTRLNSSH